MRRKNSAPARREGITIAALTMIDRQCATTFAEIERGADDRIKLGEFIPVQKDSGSPLVQSFYRGFFEATAKRLGVKIP